MAPCKAQIICARSEVLRSSRQQIDRLLRHGVLGSSPILEITTLNPDCVIKNALALRAGYDAARQDEKRGAAVSFIPLLRSDQDLSVFSNKSFACLSHPIGVEQDRFSETDRVSPKGERAMKMSRREFFGDSSWTTGARAKAIERYQLKMSQSRVEGDRS